MRHLNYSSLEKVFAKYPEYKTKVFVETGTFLGGTIVPMAQHFEQLYTIEINRETQVKAMKKATREGIKNINFICGDSAIELGRLTKELPKNKPVIFFLDGHYTKSKKGATGKGIVDVPLIYEIQHILNNRNCNDMIIIDDMRVFGKHKSANTAEADWSEITLERIFENIPMERIHAHFEDEDYDNQSDKKLNDRYYILLKKQ